MADNKVKTKNISLRFFEIKDTNTAISTKDKSIVDLFNTLLEKERVKVDDRIMPLNQADADKISDCLSYYEKRENIIFGTLLRFSNTDIAQHIPKTLMEQPRFDISQIASTKIKDNSIYKSHYYFALNDTCLITNLRDNITIKRLEAYVNWLLSSSYSFVPIVEKDKKPIELKDIKSIAIDSSPLKETSESKAFNVTTGSLFRHILKNLFLEKTNSGLKEKDLKKIMSMKVLLKFIKKPKDMSKEEYNKTLGNLLKPIADTDNIIITDKKNRKISASEIFKKELVNIEVVSGVFINELALFNEMVHFLNNK